MERKIEWHDFYVLSQRIRIFGFMRIVAGIGLFILFVGALIGGWIWLVNSIMNPLIKKAEERDKEALKNNVRYQFWTHAEEAVKKLEKDLKAAAEKSSEKEA
jgi:hypothetical protein